MDIGIRESTCIKTGQGWKFKALRFETAAHSSYNLGWAKQQSANVENTVASINTI